MEVNELHTETLPNQAANGTAMATETAATEPSDSTAVIHSPALEGSKVRISDEKLTENEYTAHPNEQGGRLPVKRTIGNSVPA